MRYAQRRAGDEARGASPPAVYGKTSSPPVASRAAPPRRGTPLGVSRLIAVTLLALVVATALVVGADRFKGALPDLLVLAMRFAALAVSFGMVGWLLVRLLRRDVGTLRSQLAAGPRGWSHRVVGRCPQCGYDTGGLRERTCPE
jgi:hypothetical protein